MHADEHRLNAIAEKIIGCAFKVANTLGCGFSEKLYENALVHELRMCGYSVQQQFPMKVHYDGVLIGEFVADLLVEGSVLVELKAVRELEDVHGSQCINYLKATKLPICLLLNFGKIRLQIKRYVHFDPVPAEEE